MGMRLKFSYKSTSNRASLHGVQSPMFCDSNLLKVLGIYTFFIFTFMMKMKSFFHNSPSSLFININESTYSDTLYSYSRIPTSTQSTLKYMASRFQIYLHFTINFLNRSEIFHISFNLPNQVFALSIVLATKSIKDRFGFTVYHDTREFYVVG